MTEEVKPNGEAGKETVAKADFDAKVAEVDRVSKELEDMRLEVFSPDYMNFLDNKDKGKETVIPEKKEVTDDEFKNLTPKQLYEKAKADIKKEVAEDIEKAKADAVGSVDKVQRQRDVASFARSHEDYETYRPLMYGISLDPKNKDLSLQELYDKSKEHVKNIHGEPSAEEKARQARLGSEKPGGSSGSFAEDEKYKKMTPDAIAKEALEETKAKLGPIPSV